MSDTTVNNANPLGRELDPNANNRTPKQEYDRDLFLTLMVAQLQYQDPLEPQSNGEMISQMATFSQLEELQAMSGSMEAGNYYALIGKGVVINGGTNLDGSINAIQGVVDSVSYINGEYSFNLVGSETSYKMKDVMMVVDAPTINNSDVMNASHLVGKTVKAEYQEMRVDEEGNPVKDETGNAIYDDIKAEGPVTKVYSKDGYVYATVQGKDGKTYEVPVNYITEIGDGSSTGDTSTGDKTTGDTASEATGA